MTKDLFDGWQTGRMGKTLAEAKAEVKAGARDGITCPCCGKFVKVYRNKLNSAMARFLIGLYSVTRKTGKKYHHVREFLHAGQKASSDGTRLRLWGLIEQKPKDPEDTANRTSGQWALTRDGAMYVKGSISVPDAVYTLNNELLGFSNENVTIFQALGRKFNYGELMRG